MESTELDYDHTLIVHHMKLISIYSKLLELMVIPAILK